MERARVASLAALFIALAVSGAVVAASAVGGIQPAAAVSWPVSTSLLLAEVQTGGASASDEFVEVTNASGASVDLVGLEVVYVTSTGGTITRKASWASSRPLAPGQHLLIANTSGVFGAIADATYSGGFAATGAALVLRPIGGAPIDAVAWGDATNAFVEGSAAAAPVTNASIERMPGGLGGNTLDTNANASDWFVQATPNPQNLAAPPVPAAGPSATPSPTPSASLTASPSATPEPTATASPTDTPAPSPSASVDASPSAPASSSSPEPSATAAASPSDSPAPSTEPTPEPTPEPTLEPTPEPTAVPTPMPTPTPVATPTPVPTPTAVPTPSPTLTPQSTPEPTVAPTIAPTSDPTQTPAPSATMPAVVSISAARLQADGSTATIEGVLSTQLGALEAGRKAFIQDATAGIAAYLDVAVTDGLPAGTSIRMTGTLDDRYAERTLRVKLADVVVLGDGTIPQPLGMSTGAIAEPVEGTRVTIDGLTAGSPTALADGLGILVDDGSGEVRAIIGADALGVAVMPSGTHVQVTGPVGQHDSTGTGVTAYRIHATLVAELEILLSPTPMPSPTPAPTSSPTNGPNATPAPTATPNPTLGPTPPPTVMPSATPAPTPPPAPGSIAIRVARAATVGSTVTVEGVVTAEGGRLGTPSLIAIADTTAGIVVRVPDGATSPGRGMTIRVTGPLADPYGQLEIRPADGALAITGTGVIPAATSVTVPDLGETTEAALVQILGTVKTAPSKGTSGDLAIDVVDASGHAFRAVADASSGIKSVDLPRNKVLRLVGVVGQHASRKGALDGYRIWLRDRADLSIVAAVGPSPTTGGATPVSVAAALHATDGATVTIEATITAGVSLLDASGRRIVVQDASGAIEVLLPAGTAGPAIGGHLRITGEKAHAWGAPRLKATTVAMIEPGAGVSPAARAATLGETDEWRLVRLSGTVLSVQRMGDRWRADMRLPNGNRIPILGQAGAGIPSTAIIEGRTATVIGIVRRPYPTATDRRFALLPRGRADVALGPATGGTGSYAASASTDSTGSGLVEGAAGSGDVTPDTDLATLFEHIGGRVHVGGLVTELTADGFLLDDGTAVARLVLHGDALVLLPHLRVGEALAAHGTVEQEGEVLSISIASAADLVRVGDLGQALPLTPGGLGGASPEASRHGTSLVDAGAVDPLPAELSVVTLAGVTGLSVLVTVLRRRVAERRSRALVLARLATLTGRPTSGAPDRRP